MTTPMDALVVESTEPLSSSILERIRALLASVSIDHDRVRCRIDATGHRLDVHLELPGPVTRGIERALAVRVLDAVRSSGTTFGNVDVHVHTGLERTAADTPAMPGQEVRT